MYLKPRLAGLLGMVVGLAMAGIGGWLIATPPLSLVGVVVLVAASLLCAVAATWTVRKSWSATDWPDLTVSEEKALRRARRVLVMQCVLAPLMIGGSVWIIFTDTRGFIGWFYLGWSALILGSSVFSLRRSAHLQKHQ